MLHDIVVMRRSIAADAAGLCARHGTDEQLRAVTQAAVVYGGYDGDLAFWTAVIDGSGNLAYRLGLNTLVAAFDDLGMDRIAALGLALELDDAAAHQELARVIADRDAAAPPVDQQGVTRCST